VGVQEPDQVASMLEAIDSYMREAFRPQPAGVHLTHVRAGDLVIWVDRDSSVTLAAVVRGTAPAELGDLLRETRERIYLSYQADLAGFGWDVPPCVVTRPMLERCLRSQRPPPPRRAHIWLAAATALVIAALAAVFMTARAQASERAKLLAAYGDTLAAEPGIV